MEQDEIHYCRFEHDISYHGGDYNLVGNFVLINWDLIEKFGHEEAFEKATGISKIHIIHYISNEGLTLDDSDGEPVYDSVKGHNLDTSDNDV